MKRNNKRRKRKDKLEFSKTLLIQESCLIWVTTLSYILLAFYCIRNGYQGTLPWLTAGVSLPWTAYGISQGFYYNKSKKENTQGGITYEMAVRDFDYSTSIEMANAAGAVEEDSTLDVNGPM